MEPVDPKLWETVQRRALLLLILKWPDDAKVWGRLKDKLT